MKDDDPDGTIAVLIAGYRYAGRSLVLQRLESAGYACVDNLPPHLVPEWLSHEHSSCRRRRIAAVVDTEGSEGIEALLRALERLDSEERLYRLVFMEAGISALRERAEAADEMAVGEADEESRLRERESFQPLRVRADLVLDSSFASPVEERDRIIALAEGKAPSARTVVEITSFGFKYGAPGGDLVLDVRFIPNPYYIADLRPLTGKDAACADYVLSHPSARESLTALSSLVTAMVPAYAAQGRAILKVRIGCTGGKHRSVAMAEALGIVLAELGVPVKVRHREMLAGRYAECR